MCVYQNFESGTYVNLVMTLYFVTMFQVDNINIWGNKEEDVQTGISSVTTPTLPKYTTDSSKL